jgi:GT2 family glycosyltransferase
MQDVEMPRTHLSQPDILSVIVLYHCELSQSQSVSSLVQILNESPELASHFALILYDNSPQPQAFDIEAKFSIEYIHDGSNGGLTSAYNTALAHAESEQCEWLLLLDQDTLATREFLVELVATAAAIPASSEVAAIVPKLMVQGIVHSPATQFIDQVRRQFHPPKQPIGKEVVGIQQQSLCAYNSGAAIRVASLRAIGGFPAEFWLDFLDHAVFHALHVQGYRVYVLRATLVHDASVADIGSMPAWRLHNVLLAQTLHVKRAGNFMDRQLFRIWLLRRSRKLRQKCKDPRMWREALLQAFLLRVSKELKPNLSPLAPAKKAWRER